ADQAFEIARQNRTDSYQSTASSTLEMLMVFEEGLSRPLWYEGKKSLDWFYQGWVKGKAIPRLELRGVKYSDKSGSTSVSGIILQKDGPEDLVTAVPVYALIGAKTILLARVFADGPATSFRVSAPAGARKIVLDQYHTILASTR